MSFSPLEWHNGTEPAINADNLNRIEQGIFEAHNAIASLNTFLEPTPLTFTVTPSVGIAKEVAGWRCGNVVFVRFGVQNAESVVAGSNIFTGEASVGLPRPLSIVTSGSFYGNHSIGATLGADGNIVIRNTSTTAIATGTAANVVNATFTYITND